MGNGIHTAAAAQAAPFFADGQAGLMPFARPYKATVANHDQVSFNQLHVEMARNATGDFNPFHDAIKWQLIRNNRFGAPIVLGFQLEMLLAHAVAQQRREALANGSQPLPVPRFGCYRFTFAEAVRVGEPVEVEVKAAHLGRRHGGTIGNRVFLRKEGRTAVAGRVEHRGERPEAMRLDFRPPAGLAELPDHSWLAGGRHFLKHRVLQASDAKNFLAGSQIAPHHYFDDLEGRARFPELFPLSLVSSALLERAASSGYDFMARPLVYAAHDLSIDLQRLRQLRDGQQLHLLVEGPLATAASREHLRYRCLGLLSRGELLFVADIRLAPLSEG